MSESKEPSPRIDWTPWVHADLFFLQNALAHGMSIAEIAGFLSKTENEVRAKAKELSDHADGRQLLAAPEFGAASQRQPSFSDLK
jgi:hypothetical protein